MPVRDDYIVKHEKLELEPKDFKNIDEIDLNPDHSITIHKFLKYSYVNEQEYDNSVKELYE